MPAPKRQRRWPYVLLVIAVALPLAWLGFEEFEDDVEPGDPPAFYSYQPPAGTAIGSPGTILRTEDVDVASSDRTVRRVLYASTDAQGEPIAVSGVVIAPTTTPPTGGWPVLAWAHGTTGVASRCAPSLDEDGGISRLPLLDELIASGTVVVATDYPGLGTPGPHPYLVSESEGRAVLDSIRAARALLPGDTDTASAIYGHSQGGHAALAAAQLVPTYGSDLGVVGVNAMAPPTALAELMERDIGEPDGIVLTALALESWSKVYPDADLDTIVHASAKGSVERVARRCVDTTAQGIVDLPDLAALRTRFLSADPATAPGWSDALADNSLGSDIVTVPLLVSQGLADTLVRPDTTTDYVNQQCDEGARIQYDTYPNVGHFELRTAAPPRVVEWLDARFAGEAVPPCATTEVSAS